MCKRIGSVFYAEFNERAMCRLSSLPSVGVMSPFGPSDEKIELAGYGRLFDFAGVEPSVISRSVPFYCELSRSPNP